MTERFAFSEKHDFLHKLEELLKGGVSPKNLKIIMPHPEHEVEDLMSQYVPKSKLKFFTLLGTLTGGITGFAFTIWTSLDWPIMTSAKPIVSLPAYIVIAFELTILIGAIFSFLGFFILAKKPDFQNIVSPEDPGNEFVILIDREDG